MKIITILFMSALFIILGIGIVSSVTFSSKEDAETYEALERTMGEVEITDIVEVLDERMEVYYTFDYKVDGDTVDTESAMVEVALTDVSTVDGQNAVKSAVETDSQQYFNQLQNEEQILVDYDDMDGWTYDGESWTEV